jgi:hypothetical protein
MMARKNIFYGAILLSLLGGTVFWYVASRSEYRDGLGPNTRKMKAVRYIGSGYVSWVEYSGRGILTSDSAEMSVLSKEAQRGYGVKVRSITLPKQYMGQTLASLRAKEYFLEITFGDGSLYRYEIGGNIKTDR